MKVILKNAVIVDPNSEWNSQKADILISDGVIEKIAKSISDQSAQVVKATNLHVSPGWFDMHVNFGQPGYEQKETLKNGVKSASFGGFTEVMLMPNTKPQLDNSTMIEYIINYTKDDIVKIWGGNFIRVWQAAEFKSR